MGFGLELNDRALALARDGTVTAVAPSIVSRGSGAPMADRLRLEPMQVSTRHWSDFSRGAVAGAAGSLEIVAAELRARLDGRPADSPLWVAAPARFDAASLGILLTLLRAAGAGIDGFVDAAAATVAALDVSGQALVLDLGLHHLSATAVDATDGAARRRRAVNSDRGGLLELYDAWLDLIAQAMVKRTRFDPLHEAVTEQRLFDLLPGIAAEAAREGRATARVDVRGERYETTLGRDQFGEAAEAVYRDIVRLLHELRPAGARVTLIVPRVVRELPGLVERLQTFEDCWLMVHPEGMAAAAASRLPATVAGGADAVRFLRRVAAHLEVPAAADVQREPLGRLATAPAASHVLHAGRAYPLGAAPIVIGRGPTASPASGAATIELPGGLAAVSRRHCTLLREGGELMLIDHSRYGTLVNGERVAGRTRLRTGDTVRLGDPPVELSLIAVGAPSG